MKCICFDTESNYFRPPTFAVGTPDEHREHFRNSGTRWRFDCAVAYDAQQREYLEFSAYQADALAALLASADELVSHRGRRVDLIVLEHALGEERVRPLWAIPHHDLFDLCSWQSLTNLASRWTPDLLAQSDQTLEDRLHTANGRWPEVNGISPPDRFTEEKPAKARRDVELTYAVYRAIAHTPA